MKTVNVLSRDFFHFFLNVLVNILFCSSVLQREPSAKCFIGNITCKRHYKRRPVKKAFFQPLRSALTKAKAFLFPNCCPFQAKFCVHQLPYYSKKKDIKNIPESKNLNQTLVLAVGKMRSKFLLASTPGLTLGDSCRIGTVHDAGTIFF